MANMTPRKAQAFQVIMQYISYKGKIRMLPGCFMYFTKRLQTICMTIIIYLQLF